MSIQIMHHSESTLINIRFAKTLTCANYRNIKKLEKKIVRCYPNRKWDHPIPRERERERESLPGKRANLKGVYVWNGAR